METGEANWMELWINQRYIKYYHGTSFNVYGDANGQWDCSQQSEITGAQDYGSVEHALRVCTMLGYIHTVSVAQALHLYVH